MSIDQFVKKQEPASSSSMCLDRQGNSLVFSAESFQKLWGIDHCTNMKPNFDKDGRPISDSAQFQECLCCSSENQHMHTFVLDSILRFNFDDFLMRRVTLRQHHRSLNQQETLPEDLIRRWVKQELAKKIQTMKTEIISLRSGRMKYIHFTHTSLETIVKAINSALFGCDPSVVHHNLRSTVEVQMTYYINVLCLAEKTLAILSRHYEADDIRKGNVTVPQLDRAVLLHLQSIKDGPVSCFRMSTQEREEKDKAFSYFQNAIH